MEGYLYLPLRSDGVDLVNEDDTWRMLFRDTEELSDEFWTISEVFLDKFRTHYTQERRRRLVCNGLCKKCLPGSRGAIQDYALWRFDTHLFVQFWVCERELHRFLWQH